MNLKIGLSKKAFIFFFAFEFCMVAIFGALLFLLHQADTESLREERAKRVIGETEQLMYVFVQAGQDVANFCRTHDKKYLQSYDTKAHVIPEKCEWLKEQFKDSPEQLKVFERLDKTCAEMLSVFNDARHQVEDAPTFESLQIIWKAREKVQPGINSIQHDALQLVETQRAIVDESPERSRKQREQYQQYVQLGFAATTLLAVGALIVFLKGVLGRLMIMEDNARRLAAEKPLNPRMPGADEIAHLDGVFHDMAAALERAKEMEREMQKMRQAFVAMVSHDLRTPLTSVRGFLELLEMGALGEVSEKAIEHTQRANNSVARLIKLINDLLDLEKMESGTIKLAPKAMSVTSLVDESLETVRVFADEQNVRLEREGVDLTITADHDRLVQVLVNLLSNAIKFSPCGGTVRVSVSRAIEHTVELRVKDEGRGVPEKYRAIIFERFQQVDETDNTKKGGTGLGLPICKAIVEQHGGSIGVDSKEGSGSEFWLRLPLQAPAPPVVHEKEAALNL